nr:hypothetical protein [Tanacetum cinerariifolium]
MDHQYPTLAKIPVLDTGKFEQWQFRIQQYLQLEHYALWEVIEFGDSYKVPESADTADSRTGRTITPTTEDMQKKRNDGRTVTVTTEDMQKRKNDVKARTTLLLSLPDEHQPRFSKYKIAQELWAAILKTLGGNEATKKTKKNLLKQQYGNFKDTACAYIASQSSGSQIKFEDINQIDEDDIEEMDIKWNMALLSMRADRAPRSQDRGRRDNYRQGSKAEEQAPKALMAINRVGWDWRYMANDEENHALVADEVAPTEFALMVNTSDKIKDLSWTGLPEFKDDTMTDYSRPAPTVESSPDDVQNSNPSVTEEASPSTISPNLSLNLLRQMTVQLKVR